MVSAWPWLLAISLVGIRRIYLTRKTWLPMIMPYWTSTKLYYKDFQKAFKKKETKEKESATVGELEIYH